MDGFSPVARRVGAQRTGRRRLCARARNTRPARSLRAARPLLCSHDSRGLASVRLANERTLNSIVGLRQHTHVALANLGAAPASRRRRRRRRRWRRKGAPICHPVRWTLARCATSAGRKRAQFRPIAEDCVSSVSLNFSPRNLPLRATPKRKQVTMTSSSHQIEEAEQTGNARVLERCLLLLLSPRFVVGFSLVSGRLVAPASNERTPTGRWIGEQSFASARLPECTAQAAARCR